MRAVGSQAHSGECSGLPVMILASCCVTMANQVTSLSIHFLGPRGLELEAFQNPSRLHYPVIFVTSEKVVQSMTMRESLPSAFGEASLLSC